MELSSRILRLNYFEVVIKIYVIQDVCNNCNVTLNAFSIDDKVQRLC